MRTERTIAASSRTRTPRLASPGVLRHAQPFPRTPARAPPRSDAPAPLLRTITPRHARPCEARAHRQPSSSTQVQLLEPPLPFTPTATLQIPAAEFAALTTLSISPDGQHVVTGSTSGCLTHYDLVSGSRRQAAGAVPKPATVDSACCGPPLAVLSLSLSNDARWAISGSNDGAVRLYDLQHPGGACTDILWPHTGGGQTWPVRHVVITPDGRRALSVGVDERLCVYELQGGVVTALLARLDMSAWGGLGLAVEVALHPEGRKAVATTCHNAVLVWEEGRGLSTLGTLHCQSVLEYVSISCDGHTAVSWAEDQMVLDSRHLCVLGELLVWDVARGECVRTLGGDMAAAAVSEDGGRAITGGCDGSVQVWDIDVGACAATLYRPEPSVEGEGEEGLDEGQEVWDVAITADGRHAVAVTKGGLLRAWELGQG